MKNLWLHGIYLSIIGILGFQLWSKTADARLAFGQVEQVLKNNCEVLRMDSDNLFNQIEKDYSTNPVKYEHFFTNAKEIRIASQSASNFIDIISANTRLHVSLNLNDFKDSLSVFSKKITSVHNKEDSLTLIKECSIIKTIQNDTFWRGFMSNPSTNFLLLKNQIKLDELVYLNYFLNKVSGRIEIIEKMFHVVIAPKKAVLIEGEKFEADIFLTEYSSNPGTGLSFTVNNQDLPIRDGVATFSRLENMTGLKNLKVNAAIRNPATGETTNIKGEFEYHVLPKCSENCQ